jgi:hypothetical protein
MSSRIIGSVAVCCALMTLRCSGDDDSDASTGNGGSATATAGAAGTTAEMTGGAAGSGMDDLDDVGFEDDVWPVLVAHCAGVGCHGAGSFLPEHANADVNVAFEEAAPVADRIAGRVSGQLMPIMPQNCGPAPGFGMCLSLDEVALIRAWVEQGAPF